MVATGVARGTNTGPDAAPTITVGVTYTGNSGAPRGSMNGSMWRLPSPLYIGSQVVVAGQSLGGRDVSMGLAGDVGPWDYVDRWKELDSSWDYDLEDTPSVKVLSTGTACDVCYLEMGHAAIYRSLDTDYPYQFVVQSIKHRASLSITSASRRGKRLSVYGKALMADAATPVPAGTVVTLTLWRKGYKANLTAAAGADGSLAYGARVPWKKKRVKMKLRLAGSSYVSSSSAKVVR